MEIFGGLVEFNDSKEFIDFMDAMDVENAIKLMEVSIKYVVKTGVFEFDEIYAMHKCLQKIKSHEDSKITTIPDADRDGSTDSDSRV